MHDADTIAAISSPPGEGGIGIIRMSGPLAHSILKKMFRPRRKVKAYASHRLYLGCILDPITGLDVDEVFAVLMKEPRTYTREQMTEVFCHGGLAAQKRTLEITIHHGARIAEPGEFTKRAYLNGRIDLVQAESVLDVIESQTAQELQCALDHAKGKLTMGLATIRKEIVGLLAEVEAHIDFPDEDLALDKAAWPSRLATARAELARLVSSYYEGRAIKQGLDVLIVGRTNVGKSSLLNAIVLSDKAIVTPLPGTTRDLVEDTVVVKGTKLKITDTAGLRDSKDPIERIGIDKARDRIPEADVILWVLDSSAPYAAEDERVYEELAGKRIVALLNKIDLPLQLDARALASKDIARTERVSALTGSGIPELKASLYDTLMGAGAGPSGLIVTNVRHRNLLKKAEEALGRAEECLACGSSPEIVAFELRDAVGRLTDLTGETAPEEVLSEIFNRFCIGK